MGTSGSFSGKRFSCGLSGFGSPTCWGDCSAVLCVPPSPDYDQLSLGTGHACGVLPGGALECWGSNLSNQLSDAPTWGSWIEVAAGQSHSCAVQDSYEVTCWGNNSSGQLTVPLDPSTGSPYLLVSVAVGSYHSCGITLDGYVVCWGQNSDGQATPPAALLPP